MSVDPSQSALLLAATHLRPPMPANDRQRFAVTAVVKRWWTRTRDLCRSRKRISQTGKFEPQVSCNLKSSSKYPDWLCKGIDFDTTQPKGSIVHLEEDTVVPKEDVVCPEEDLLHHEDVVGSKEEDLVQPEEDAICPEQDTLVKDISIFQAGASGEYVPRSCTLDSGAPINLISQGALKGIQCNVKCGPLGVVRGLGSFRFPVKETVTLRFRFWDRDEIFEAEFRVLPTIRIFDREVGPGFDILLCWNWMKTHRRAWDSVLEQANERRWNDPG
jgi:hypothetical protein